ncbi:MAG: hypothetical protein ABSE45_03295 [Candidatus Acidiferrales bacterium]|jgi:hypothetical protein
MSLPVLLRSTDEQCAEGEDVGEVVNFNSEGLYFTTTMLHYSPGMKLVVTFPYGEHAPVQRKFLATIVRVEHCWIGTRGVAVSLGTQSDTGTPAA